ncbi:type II secretion system protein [Sulfurovum sp.]|uniref:type II secretion system protein n=1 Tax=Sulfurovum sp. TaxID=1969726 RepID=UPI002867FA26|nr:type II secretion system protein [Sulfurovum sp.]
MRKAIAMIELIFAIVIMGIILMSAPMLISQASKSGYVAIQQEGINEAATQVNLILGHYWDENNVDETEDSIILQTGGNAGLNEDNSSGTLTGRRAGTPDTSFRTFLTSTGLRLTATGVGTDTGETLEEHNDDMDDFDASTSLAEIQSSPDANYIETTTINIARNVTYMADAPGGGSYLDPTADNKITFSDPFSAALPGGTTNIKQISVTLTSTSAADELEKQIVLRAFTCNIGSFRLEEQ